MAIDPVTLIAQLVNFAVLVVLLRLLLYRPVTEAMARRQARVAAELEDAADREARAEEAEQEWRRRKADLDAEADAIRAAARDEALAEKARLFEESRHELEHRQAEWNEAVTRSRAALAGGVARDVAARFDRALRQALRDLADTELDAHVLDRLALEIRGLPPEERSLLEGATDVNVKCAAPVDADRRRAVESLVREVAPRASIRLEVDPALIAGLELRAGGSRWGWSAARFVDGITAGLLAPEATDEAIEVVR